MISFDEFIAKWNLRYLEVAGSADAKNQCVDLVNGYIRDVLGLPIIEWTNAVDFPNKVDKNKYDFIPNGEVNFPLKGDIVVWKPSPGHIAVAIEGNGNRFSSFDQNFPVGSVCHIQEHSYVNVVGWLRAKPQGETPQQTIDRLRRELDDLDKQKKEWEVRAGEYQKQYSDLKSKYDSIINQIKGVIAQA